MHLSRFQGVDTAEVPQSLLSSVSHRVRRQWVLGTHETRRVIPEMGTRPFRATIHPVISYDACGER